MSKEDAPGFRAGKRNCCNCQHAQFVGMCSNFCCTKYDVEFDGTVDAASYVCKKWEPELPKDFLSKK